MHRFKEPPDKINKGDQNTLLNEQVPWGTEPALLYFVRLIVPRGQHMVKNYYGHNMGKLKLLSPYECPRFTLHPAVFHGLAAL